ncbi:MAG: YARHG domain-containing protein [Alphaproteobacteria bacterium]|nr:YARHG domain-containing protein [Alphaproteobacteria bacterium]MCB9694280.1 YARHG domain-containing protein [Alphaproteobacteria bacterium]
MYTALLLLACGGPAPVAAPDVHEAPALPEPAPTPDPEPAPAPVSGDPLAGLSDKEICGSDALLLIRHDYADLASGGYHKLCCGPGMLGEDEGMCGLDWPFNDVPSCEAWASMRNAVFARYGYVFTKEKWQKRFEGQPWYRKNPAFDPSQMSEVARRNTALLKKNEEDHVMCEAVPEE